MDEGTHSVRPTANIIPHQVKNNSKDININVLFEYLRNKQQAEAIEFLRTYKLSDLSFYRGFHQEYANYFRVDDDRKRFYLVDVELQRFNIL